MSTRNILLKDFKQWAEGLTAKIRNACEASARALNIPIMYLRSSQVDKEQMARRIAEQRKIKEGNICMFSVVEPCMSAILRADRVAKKLKVQIGPRKCVWIYHYWNDPVIGFGHTRLQTWLPFSATVCINGRHWLERQLKAESMSYVKEGNCFPYIRDIRRAQELMDMQQKTRWNDLLTDLLQRNCPAILDILETDKLIYYWSADQTEWATDIMFKNKSNLDGKCDTYLRHGLITSQSSALMRFFGRTSSNSKSVGRMPKEIKSTLKCRYEGLVLRHYMNDNSIKMYNKAGNILRIETTINATRQFKVYRKANDDPSKTASWQKMRKGISDMHRRAQVSQKCNNRYADHLAGASISQTIMNTARDICSGVVRNEQKYRAINPWREDDFKTIQFIARGEINLNGFRNCNLREWLYHDVDLSDRDLLRRVSSKISRRLRLLRAHGLIKKIAHTNRYCLTSKGHKVATAILAASHADVQQLMKMIA